MTRSRENADGARLDAPLASPAFTGTVSGIPSSGFKSMQVFATAGTFTGGSGWQRPSGITTIKVYVTGGGGGW